MSGNCVLAGCCQSGEVYAVMVVEAFVLGINQRLKELGRDAVKGYRGAVLVEELAYQLAVGRINLGRLRIFGVHDIIGGGGAAEQPEEVHHDGEDIENDERDKTDQQHPQTEPPAVTAKQTYVPAKKRACRAKRKKEDTPCKCRLLFFLFFLLLFTHVSMMNIVRAKVRISGVWKALGKYKIV